jgi:hypothetical protein
MSARRHIRIRLSDSWSINETLNEGFQGLCMMICDCMGFIPSSVYLFGCV